jgi:two-component system chemotaxis sensor kinase CheA
MLEPEEAATLTDQEALQLIFLPGISTRDVPGKLSGRGVGMDVVKTNIGRVGGVVDVHSEAGIGSKFTITLPITLAIISALMVRVGANVYAIPLSSVQEAVMLDGAAVRTIEGREIVTMRGESLPICRLAELFLLPAPRDPSRRLLVVVAAAATRRCGFVVDHILGRQDIVIKPLSGPLRGVAGFAGATELGDQRIGLVIDVPSLLEEALASTALPRLAGAGSHG